MRPRKSTMAFSLVELLGVVLILGVLAASAVPLYNNTRRTSAARACKANIRAVEAAESAYALRNNIYTNLSTLASGGPEGLSSSVTCPLDNATYRLKRGSLNGQDVTVAGTQARIWIVCPNAASHVTALTGSATSDWQQHMQGIGAETTP